MDKECNCKLCKVVKETILHMSDCDDMKEAVDYFEQVRHKRYLPRSHELFNELATSQVAILFKVLIDSGQLEVKNNVVCEPRQNTKGRKRE